MSDLTFLEKVNVMPPDFQQEVKDFIDFVWEKKMGLQAGVDKSGRIPGLLKGKTGISPDFDKKSCNYKLSSGLRHTSPSS